MDCIVAVIHILVIHEIEMVKILLDKSPDIVNYTLSTCYPAEEEGFTALK